ncbi:hypothetical protein J8281_02240 [Aquimarina sp. U1-2]|uniref:DinB family protein n=1 Tax=Aquimarina sp. U1-2 TaxID=2823141 RepID=UPI001AECB7DA|nr:hypothetical protein [Aquimarina sp. U1-2]MBP2830994.1 hypothetical protein [Aquimarina sp. U1-2]
MKIKAFFIVSIYCFMNISFGQKSAEVMQLPYQQIPDYPEDFTSGNIIVRFIDGLGYRYYWATEGLTEKDLIYTPSEEGRSMLQTLVHIYELSKAILNAPQNLPNLRNTKKTELTFEELRKHTLLNLEKSSRLLAGKSSDSIADYKVIFKSEKNQREFPYWNMINGQLSDAIYHVGQIVSFRRSNGNPMHPKVNVFLGTTKL